MAEDSVYGDGGDGEAAIGSAEDLLRTDIQVKAMSDIETMREMLTRAGVEFYDEEAEYSPTRRLEPDEQGIWIRRDDIWITWFFGPDGSLKSMEVSEMRDRTDD